MGVLVFAIIVARPRLVGTPILVQFLWLDVVRKRAHLTGAGGARGFGRGLRAVSHGNRCILFGAAAPTSRHGTGAPGTVLIGLGLETVGVLILVPLMGTDTNGWIIAAPLTLYGLGLGFASATQSTVRLGQWCRP